MAQVSESIPNFVQAVSQQSPSLRLPSQLAACENGLPSIIEGMKKRPPLEHVAVISETAIADAKVHFSNRDIDERYIFVVSNGALKVYDRDTGVEQTVNTPDGVGYLATATPKTSFRLMTVVDYTFIINRDVVAAMDPTLVTVPDFRAFITVKIGLKSTRHAVYVNGTQVANYVSGTDPDDDDTDKHAGLIAAQLLVNLPPVDWNVSTFGNVIIIKRNDGATFGISIWDSNGSDTMTVTTDRVQRFSDLPEKSPDGQTVEVVGEEGASEDNFYVRFTGNDTGVDAGDGVWEETVKPGITFKFNPSTMPHVIVREADNTFTFKQATWAERTVGDEESAPTPSFIGKTLEGMTFWENRFGIIADDNCVLSRGGSEYFDFWPKTAKAVLDDDPIDLGASYTKVAKLRHAIPFDRKLLLFADQSQWVMEGGQTVTPTNTGMDLISEYISDEGAEPTAAGTRVFFPTARGNFTAIQEMIVASDVERLEATNTAEHVPKYIPSGIIQMVTAPGEDVLMCLSALEPTRLYVYNWHISGRNKDQSAWHRFNFNLTDILAIDTFQSELFILYNKGGKTLLGKLLLDPGRVDFDTETFRIHLDHRLDQTQVSSVYDPGSDTTTITLPFAMVDPQVVDTEVYYGDTIKAHSGTTSSIVVNGTLPATFYIGENYTHSFTLSELILRRPSQSGGFTPITTGRLQVKRMSVRFEDTGYFRVEVKLKFRDPFVYTFTGKIIGEGGNLIGTLPITDGDFGFPVSSKADRVEITFINDTILPSNLLMAQWEGEFTPRNR